MLQIVSTMSHVYEGLKSHQRELVDVSDTFYTESLLRLKFLKARDDHLRSADFLDVEHHPEITFTGNQVEVKGEHDYTVAGDLTIRGVTRKAMLNVSYRGQWETPWWEDGVDKGPRKRAGFLATTQINRQDFGVSWQDTMDRGGIVVSDEVDIAIDVEAVLEV